VLARDGSLLFPRLDLSNTPKRPPTTFIQFREPRATATLREGS
jgi:hypothetical protein